METKLPALKTSEIFVNKPKPLFQGIIPPLVTPLADRDLLDTTGLHRLIEHVIAGGVQGIFLLGTTGEAPSLSYRLREELIETACQQIAGRVPVLVGIADTAFVESLRIARKAKACGADGLVLTTPYYFPAGQTELLHYVENLLAEITLPIMLYNMPSMTKVWFEQPTLEKLTAYPEIVGLKDSSGNLDYFQQAVQWKVIRPDWSLLIGPEVHLLRAMEMGADGGVCGGGNIFPRLFAAAYQSVMLHEKTRQQELQADIERLQQIYEIGKYASRFIKATKSALSIRGVCSDRLAEPFDHFLEPERTRVDQILKSLAYWN